MDIQTYLYSIGWFIWSTKVFNIYLLFCNSYFSMLIYATKVVKNWKLSFRFGFFSRLIWVINEDVGCSQVNFWIPWKVSNLQSCCLLILSIFSTSNKWSFSTYYKLCMTKDYESMSCWKYWFQNQEFAQKFDWNYNMYYELRSFKLLQIDFFPNLHDFTFAIEITYKILPQSHTHLPIVPCRQLKKDPWTLT